MNAGPGHPTHGHISTPSSATHGSAPQRSSTPIPRPGKRRELEEDGLPNGSGVGSGGVNGNTAHGQMHAHPGLKRPPMQQGVPGKSGVPRPAKRPRTVSAGLFSDVGKSRLNIWTGGYTSSDGSTHDASAAADTSRSMTDELVLSCSSR